MIAINLWFFFYLVKSFSFSLFSRFYVDCLTCNMACMGLFYHFPLCSVCCFLMFLMPCHGEYHTSPFCRSFYTGEHPQSRPQVQLVLVLAGAGSGWCWLASPLPPRGGGDRAEARRGGRGKLEEKGSLGLGLELGH